MAAGRDIERGSNNLNSNLGSFPSLTSEQWSNLLTLHNNPNSSQSDKLSSLQILWIFYSAFSHHMVGKKDFFLRNLNTIFPYTISLPNGAETIALQKGIVHLNPKL